MTQLEVEAWHDAIGDLDYQEAMGAVRGIVRGSDARVKPAHVAAAVKSARNDAFQRVIDQSGVRGVPKPANFEAMIAAAQEATREAIAAGYSRGSDHVSQVAFRAAEAAR